MFTPVKYKTSLEDLLDSHDIDRDDEDLDRMLELSEDIQDIDVITSVKYYLNEIEGDIITIDAYFYHLGYISDKFDEAEIMNIWKAANGGFSEIPTEDSESCSLLYYQRIEECTLSEAAIEKYLLDNVDIIEALQDREMLSECIDKLIDSVGDYDWWALIYDLARINSQQLKNVLKSSEEYQYCLTRALSMDEQGGIFEITLGGPQLIVTRPMELREIATGANNSEALAILDRLEARDNLA